MIDQENNDSWSLLYSLIFVCAGCSSDDGSCQIPDTSNIIEARIQDYDDPYLHVEVYRIHGKDIEAPLSSYELDLSNADTELDIDALHSKDYPVWLTSNDFR